MQNFMRNSKEHLVKFFHLRKESYRQKRRCSILLKINFFTDSVLRVEVLKW